MPYIGTRHSRESGSPDLSESSTVLLWLWVPAFAGMTVVRIPMFGQAELATYLAKFPENTAVEIAVAILGDPQPVLGVFMELRQSVEWHGRLGVVFGVIGHIPA